ncbi:MAG: alpha/beta fold hydrolase [Aquincola sp.]|nr:alpha/beta fold hydrolase [Aquincola sp.]MDH4289734.1 alpha/beta fold hydrolase [Aquincola sp.]MDH5330297.1 alpha/beta fold hydrolase [Aquincola sp.]
MQISANGISIEVDDQGPPDSPGGPPILMIMGLGMQLTAWPEPLVQRLVDRGRRVIRIDNRDAGLSQGYDHLGVPSFVPVMLRYFLHQPVHAPYTIGDMASDALGVLDALGVARAQVVGASMGGMVAQHLAAEHGERIACLTLIMTTSGARRLPQPSARVRMALLDRGKIDPHDVEALVDRMEHVFDIIGSPAFRPDRDAMRDRIRSFVTRAYRPQGVVRHIVAVVADGDRSPLLARIIAPTHIVHGAADPLVPVAAAHDLHAKIAGSTLEVIEGMGHDLPAALWPRLAESIAGVAH